MNVLSAAHPPSNEPSSSRRVSNGDPTGQTSATDLFQSSLSSTKHRRKPRDTPEAFSFGPGGVSVKTARNAESAVVPLPLWPDIPRQRKIHLSLIARNFELIDRVLSSCIDLRAVSSKIKSWSETEEQLPMSPQIKVARLYLACRERSILDPGAPKATAPENITMFSLNRALTSPLVEKWFYHNSEDIVSYLANPYDLPYWKIVLDWLAEVYRIKDSAYDFVRLVIYSLESLCRFITQDLENSDIRSEMPTAVVASIEQKLGMLTGMLDEVFPTHMDKVSRYTQSLDTKHRNASDVALEQKPDTKSSGTPEQTQDPSIAALVTLSTVAAAPFIGLGWTTSNHQPGTTDSNFWFLISGALIQVIGAVVVAIPLWRKSYLSKAWVWVWIWLCIALLAAIASVVLYVSLPTEWSSFAAFLASAAQAFTTLQLMFAIPKNTKQE